MYARQLCTNCSSTSHTTKQCQFPVTSYGVIVFRINTEDGLKTQATTLLSTPSSVTGFESNRPQIQFLLIQRRDSIGFVEIIRGKYKLTDEAYIKQQLAGMTKKERQRIVEEPFDSLWDTMWGLPSTQVVDAPNTYRHEKEISRGKLEALRAEGLSRLLTESEPGWDTPEWGFPKGRRDANEKEFTCAMRELWEETNLALTDIFPIRNLDPISETFFGTNHVHYCHKYFLAYFPTGGKQIGMDATNEHMLREVGDIGWFSLEDAIAKIRPDQVEKREVLLRASSLLKNYCPLLSCDETSRKV